MSVPSAFASLRAALTRLDLPSRARILVAVSGGPDSTALLRALAADAPAHGWELSVGHVNHMLRGAESEEDERFVRMLSGRYHIPCDVAHVPTATHARARHLSLETAARELRYAALRSMLESWGGDVLMTGHTLDDQAETLLLNLLRGTGLDGLTGMRWRNGSLLRPFLGVRRGVVLEALRELGQGCQIDSSNADLAPRRNRIRHRVLPLLAEIQPDVVGLLGRTASVLTSDADYLDRSARALHQALDLRAGGGEISASASAWRTMHPSLRARVLKQMIECLVGVWSEVDAGHLRRLGDAIVGGHDLLDQLPHGICAYVDGARFTLRRGTRTRLESHESLPLSVPGCSVTTSGTVLAELLEEERLSDLSQLLAVCGPSHALLDADAAGERLTIGPRQPGDRIQLLGRTGSKKLQDLFVDLHVPEPLRDRIPVIRGATEIVWIPGIGVSVGAAATGATKRVAHLRYTPVLGGVSATILGLFRGKLGAF